MYLGYLLKGVLKIRFFTNFPVFSLIFPDFHHQNVKGQAPLKLPLRYTPALQSEPLTFETSIIQTDFSFLLVNISPVINLYNSNEYFGAMGIRIIKRLL